MKLQIINDKRYSAGRWRVVDQTGEAIYVPKVLDLEQGKRFVNMPLCSETKEGLISELLDLLVRQQKIITDLRGKNDHRQLATPGPS
jgi:hypothetical protein